MADTNRSEEQLVRELDELRRRVSELELAEAEHKQVEKDLATLLAAIRTVSSTLALEQVLTLIAEQAIEAIGVSGCTISRWEKDTDSVVTWIQNRKDGFPLEDPGTAYALDDYPATRNLLQTRQFLAVRLCDPNADPSEIAYMQQSRIQSLLMLPLVVGEEAIGLVELDESNQERKFTSAEVRLAQALVDQAAIAINNSQLYESLRHELSARKRVEAALRQAHDELEQRVEARTVELMAANDNLGMEVRERRQTEDALRESEKRYQVVSELTSDFAYAFYVEPDGALVLEWVTGAFTHITGFTPDEMQAHGDWTSLVHPDDKSNVLEGLQDVLYGQAGEADLRIITKGNDVRWLHVRSHPVWSENQQRVIRVYGAIQDITEQKRVEQLFQALNQAAIAMAQTLTPNEIFSAAAGELKKLGFDCMLLLLDESKNRLLARFVSFDTKAIRAAEKLTNLSLETYSIPIKEVEVYRKVVKQRTPVLIEDGFNIIQQMLPIPLRGLAGQIVKIMNIPKSVTVPLVVADEVIGVLAVHSNDLSRDDIPAVTAFANQMAAAWNKAELLELAQRELYERKQAQEALRQSQERFAFAIDATNDGLWDWDVRSGQIYFSPRYYTMLGYEPGEMPATYQTWQSLLHPDDIERTAKTIQQHIEHTAEGFEVEFRLRRKDGGWQWILSRGKVVERDEKGNPIRVVGTHTDITERKQTETTLKENEELFRLLFERAPIGMAITTLDGQYQRVNQALCDTLGYKQEEMKTRSFVDVSPTEDVPANFALREKVIRGEIADFQMEKRFITKAGEVIHTLLQAALVHDAQGQPSHFVGQIVDITERKRAEEVLQFEREQLLSIFDSIDEIIYVADTDSYEILYVNKALQDALQKKLVGGICYKEFQGLDSPCEFCTNDIILQQKYEPYWWEFHNSLLGRDYAIVDRIIKWPDGRDVRFELAIDNTERKRVEEALRESEIRFRSIFDQTYQFAGIVALDGTLTAANQTALGFIGGHEADVVGKPFWDTPWWDHSAELKDWLRDAISQAAQGEVVRREITHVSSHGDLHYFDFSLKPVVDKSGRAQYLIPESRDITESKLAEDALRRRNAELELFNRTGQALNSSLNLDRVLITMLDEVRHLLYAAGCLVWLKEPATDDLICQHSVGSKAEMVRGWRVRAGEGIAGWVVRHGKSVIIPDVLNDERYSQQVARQLDLTIRSILAVPLRVKDNVIGVLEMADQEVDRFTLADLTLVESVAASAATAIENARLYGQVKAARDYARTVLDSLHDEVVILNQEYIITDVNVAYLAKTGYTREEALGQYCYRLAHRQDEPCDSPDRFCPVAEVWATGRSVRGTHIHYNREGDEAYVDIAASPLFDEQGQVTHVIEAQRDVTIEQQLQERLTTIQSLGQELVLFRDETQIAQAVMSAAEHMLEFQLCSLWRVDENKGTLFRQATTAAGQQLASPVLHRNSEQGIISSVAHRGEAIYLPDVRLDSRYIDLGMGSQSELCVPLKVRGRVIGVLNAESKKLDAFQENDRQLFASLADQAALALENARLFAAVARSEREWEATFDAIADGIALVDADFHILRANRTLAEWLHNTPQALTGRTCYELLDHSDVPPEQCPHILALQSGQPQTVEKEIPGLEGMFLIAKYPLHDQEGIATATVHTFKDITERQRMEQQLIHSERLSAMGKLAASVAHEINNPLQSVIGCLGLAREELTEGKDVGQYLRIALDEVRRAARTVGQLRDLGRSESGEKEPAQVNTLLEEVLALSKKQCQESGVEVVWKPARDLPWLSLATDQIKQVFLNLVFNALEAMPDGGQLEVTTSCIGEPAEIRVEFSDSGGGIATSDLPRIFEPFFSTKREGMGLGLSVSYGIVEQHSGRIDVDSQEGQGSKFTIWLPI